MTLRARLVEPVNARILGVARIGVGVAALMELAASGPRVLLVADPGAIRLPIVEPVGTIVLGAPVPFLAVWLIAGIAFVLGARTAIAGTLLTLIFLGLVTADQQLYSNHSYLIALVIGILTAADAGRSLSLDARRRGTDDDPAPAWTVMALRAQLSIVYAFAALAKLNPSFLSGSVVSASLRRDGLAFPEAWIGFESMFVLSLLVVVGELFLAVGLWRRRWRPVAFVVGMFLHVGIVATMHAAWDLAVFSVVTLSLYVAFLNAPRGGLSVVWDDGCGFCGAWVRWLRRLDWLDVHRFVPSSALAASGLPVDADAAAEALHLVEPRRVTRGFEAVRRIGSRLPISFLWAPLLAIPPIPVIGEQVYRRVAARRTCPVAGAGEPATTSARQQAGARPH